MLCARLATFAAFLTSGVGLLSSASSRQILQSLQFECRSSLSGGVGLRLSKGDTNFRFANFPPGELCGEGLGEPRGEPNGEAGRTESGEGHGEPRGEENGEAGDATSR